MRRWIASGLPVGAADAPTVAKITVVPEQRVLLRNNGSSSPSSAHYTDGSVEDVTRRGASTTATIRKSPSSIRAGLVRTLAQSGEKRRSWLAIRGTSPRSAPTGAAGRQDSRVQVRGADPHRASTRWPSGKQLGLVPSELCSETNSSCARSVAGPDRHAADAEAGQGFYRQYRSEKAAISWSITCWSTPEYAYYFANKWADILRVKPQGHSPSMAEGTFGFHDWIRDDAVAKDMPYDEFARGPS